MVIQWWCLLWFVQPVYNILPLHCFSHDAAKERIEEVLDEATKSLLRLDDGGFKLNLVKVEMFSTSPFYFEIG